MCPHVLNRDLNAAAVVSDTATFIERMIAITTNGGHRDRKTAIAAIARDAKVAPSAVRGLVQPSRRPKGLTVDVWLRLRGAYLVFLTRQLAALEAEAARVEALGNDDAAVAHLLDKTRALTREVEGISRR